MTVRLTLDVHLDGQHDPAGHLEALEDGNVRFRYSDAALAAGRAISLSLPLGETPFGDAITRAFFDNVLPENDQMQRVLDREGLDRADIVDILAHIGADCPGAISCVPAGSGPIKVPGELAGDYRPLDPRELAIVVQRLADRQPLPGDIVDPSPVAGVQRKLAVTKLPDGQLALPAEGRKVPTTHILKVPRRAEAAEAIQEAAACSLARACGFEVSGTEHFVYDGVDAVLIERFDRVIIDDVVYRLHQEDFAQALGLPARLKYQRNGVVGRRFDTQAVRALLDRLSAPAQARETFVLATLFNLAIGNTDNHAKNHGILYLPDGRVQLTPLYDLLPIRLHRRYTHELAYHLGEAAHLDDMTSAQMARFLSEFALEGGRARRFIEGPVRRMFETLERQAPVLRKLGQRFFDDLIGRELGQVCNLLNLEMPLRDRDYFEPEGAGGWLAPS